MTTYLVAGGIFPGRQGEERFTLVCPSSEELPYVFEDGVMSYFKLIWQHAHLYRVEDDYTLALRAFSPEAIHWGVKAPERVTPDTDLLEKLRAVLQPCQTGLKPNGTKIVKSIGSDHCLD